MPDLNRPDVSVVIPVYNRGEMMRYSLESVRRASAGLAVETIVVDDGSNVPVSKVLPDLGFHPDQVIRQENAGLLFARLTGLNHAHGRYVLFLDSDDLVSADKLTAQVSAMDRALADVSYTNAARVHLEGDYDKLQVRADAASVATDSAPELFINIQPAPHSPLFRRSYLNTIVAQALFPPSPLYNPVAEIWFYHHAAVRPGKVVYVPGPLAIVGEHPGVRLTNHWERLGVASLAVMEAFARNGSVDTPQAQVARQTAGEKAFRGWRALPRNFSPDFSSRSLAVWRQLTQGKMSPALGGTLFQSLAVLLGPVNAGQLLKAVHNPRYETCRTLPDSEMARLLSALPPAQINAPAALGL